MNAYQSAEGTFELIFPPRLIITVCGTLKAQVVLKIQGCLLRVRSSDEIFMEMILKFKANEKYKFLGTSTIESFTCADGKSKMVETIIPSEINNLSSRHDKSLLLILYKYAINNYHNKDLVVAYASLDEVQKQFENLFNILSPLHASRYVEAMISEDMKKEFNEHTMKTLEYVDKLSKAFLISVQGNKYICS